MAGGVCINSYAELALLTPVKTKLRGIVRDAAVLLRSMSRSIGQSSDWIRFPYYHHVFADERKGFEEQLKYLGNFGEFISLDDAVYLLESPHWVDGRYFCITFDDGIRCCYDHATPILAERGIPATFFIVTDYTASDAGAESRICRPLHPSLSYAFEYLTWQECGAMIDAGMTIGSHTCAHVKLSGLDVPVVTRQLADSKAEIERRLGGECMHFACPWGVPVRDFIPDRDPIIAREAGYSSFLTTRRGMNVPGGSAFAIKRDHILAAWGNYQLRYFLSL